MAASEEKGTPSAGNLVNGTALNNRKSSKMRRDKFGSLKKH